MCLATIPASDIDRARRWYSEKLGLEPAQQLDEDLRYETGNGTGFLLYPSQFAGKNQGTAMGWSVTDFDADVAELRRRGVTFEDYDFPGFKTENGIMTKPNGERGAWFKDSEGNILAIDSAAP
jgi:catechol 2,3-dioxygenase-like lactoylglutathione lyase family enzyme